MLKQKKKICIIMTLAWPLFNSNSNVVFGGAEVDMYNLAVSLAEKGKYDVLFLTGDFGQEYERCSDKVKVRKIKYLGDSSKKTLYHKILRQLYIWMEIIHACADLYITETAGEMPAWTALVGKKLLGAKVVHRLASDADTDMNLKKKLGFKYYNLYRYGLKNADLLISQTEKQKELLYSTTGLNSIVIRNGLFVDIETNYLEKIYILWVSRALPIKRPGLFLEMARRLPEEKFVIIMPANKFNKTEDDLVQQGLKALVEETSRTLSNLEYVEYVPFKDIQKYYDKAKLFINSSEYEGFPNAFMQSCLGKTPILSFRVNPDNFISNYNIGYICDDSIEKAVHFVKTLNTDRIKNYGDNAYDYIKKYHDMVKIADEYDQAITKLLL